MFTVCTDLRFIIFPVRLSKVKLWRSCCGHAADLGCFGSYTTFISSFNLHLDEDICCTVRWVLRAYPQDFPSVLPRLKIWKSKDQRGSGWPFLFQGTRSQVKSASFPWSFSTTGRDSRTGHFLNGDCTHGISHDSAIIYSNQSSDVWWHLLAWCSP